MIWSGGVPELDGELLELLGHVVGGVNVEVPSVNLLIARALPEEGVSSQLVEVE